jgi:hypothetical protein
MNFFLGNTRVVKADVHDAADGLEGIASAVKDGATSQQISEAIKGVVGVGASSEQISSVISKAMSQPCAAGKMLSKLENSYGDATVFVCSDSTGNETDEWVYLYAQWLAEKYPLYGVKYYLWDVTGGTSYLAVNDIQATTNGFYISIYNGAISGSKISHLMGSKFNVAVRDIPDADLIIINHGHNHVNSYNKDTTAIVCQRVPQYLEAIAQILDRHSGAGVIMLTQNPRTDGDDYKYVYRSIIEAAAMINADIADSYAIYIKNGSPLDWYKDGLLHPSQLGAEMAYLPAIKALHSSVIHRESSVFSNAKNLLPQGDLSAFTGTTLTGWDFGDLTMSKDTTNYESNNGYSMKAVIAGTKTAISLTMPTANLKGLKGRYCTLVCKVYIPTNRDDAAVAQSSTVARARLITNSNAANNYLANGDQRDGWHYRMMTVYVSPTDTYLYAGLYVDSAGLVGTAVSIDYMTLIKGRKPSLPV